jgi:hypothetical protein
MIQKQTYEDLEQRIQELKKEAFDRNRIEEALEESETRYRRLFETAQDGILILDAGTERIEDANPFIVDRYLDKPLKGYADVCRGEYAVLTIYDNGLGLSKEDLGRFDRA